MNGSSHEMNMFLKIYAHGCQNACISLTEKKSVSVTSTRNGLRLSLPQLPLFSGILQLLCTYDPQLFQGLIVDEKRASIRETNSVTDGEKDLWNVDPDPDSDLEDQ
jgi:hypothetical protein